MQCPRCKTSQDLHLSRSGNQNLSFFQKLWCVAVRCHRCGNLFHVAKAITSSLREASVEHHHRRRKAA